VDRRSTDQPMAPFCSHHSCVYLLIPRVTISTILVSFFFIDTFLVFLYMYFINIDVHTSMYSILLVPARVKATAPLQHMSQITAVPNWSFGGHNNC
jgi:hypothetical protein